MKFVFSGQERALQQATEELERRLAEAEAGAVADVADLAVRDGRANIAAAGFSNRWVTGFQSRFFSNKGGEPAALVFHSIGLASVFETGVTIQGQPLLWLPIADNLPAGVRSPRQYGGKLVSVNVAGKPPLLFDADDRKRGPLFFGTPQVTLRKRFDLRRIIEQAAGRIGEFLDRRLKG